MAFFSEKHFTFQESQKNPSSLNIRTASRKNGFCSSFCWEPELLDNLPAILNQKLEKCY